MPRSIPLLLAGALALSACGDESIPTALSEASLSSPTATLEGPTSSLAPITGRFRTLRTPTPNSQPRHITLGSDGNIWFTESALNVSRIGRVTSDGRIREIAVPTRGGQPSDIVSGPDGALWFTQPSGFPDAYIVRLTTAGQFTQFAPECDPDFGCSIVPNGITSGPDGNVWFTEGIRDAIVRLTPSGAFTFYTIPTPSAYAQGITVGPDDALWFAELNGNQIGRIDPVTGSITEFGPATGSPFRITAGPDGNLWFTDLFNNKIGRFTPPTPSTPDGVFAAFSLPSPSGPRDIVAGPDGNLWFTEYDADWLSQITPDGVVRRVQRVPGGPWGIGRGSGNELLVAQLDGSRVGGLRFRP